MAQSSKHRDWGNDPDAVSESIWPCVIASGLPQASSLALLATCRGTLNAMLLEAPCPKLQLQLAPDRPSPSLLLRLFNRLLFGPAPPDPDLGIPLRLLKQSKRTQGSTLALLHTSTQQPPSNNRNHRDNATVDRAGQQLFIEETNPNVRLAAIVAASTKAQGILRHPCLVGLSCITRLELQRVIVDNPLLQAMQGLPRLKHLVLTDTHAPATPRSYLPDGVPLVDWSRWVGGYDEHYHYEPLGPNFPKGLLTLHVELHTGDSSCMRTLLLEEFLLLDTITHLTSTFTRAGDSTHNCTLALWRATQRGLTATTALRKVSLDGTLTPEQALLFKRYAPQLEELQVDELGLHNRVRNALHSGDVVSWRTLRLLRLNLAALLWLPLGGTEPLDIHVSGVLMVAKGGASAQQQVDNLIQRITSQQTRPVHLVGGGGDGGAFTWHNWDGDYPAGLGGLGGLSVLQLSKAPVRRLDIGFYAGINVEQLVLAVQPLTALTHLSLSPLHGNTLDGAQADLLARLPLHVTHVRLGFERTRAWVGGVFMPVPPNHEHYQRMAVIASRVPNRQAQPLHLSVVGAGPGSDMWQAVEECHARGATGVIMEEVME